MKLPLLMILAVGLILTGCTQQVSDNQEQAPVAEIQETPVIENASPVLEDGTMVGGVLMAASSLIGDNLAKSNTHTTFMAAFEAAELKASLNQEGPITVFAPVDSSFSKLTAGTIDTLLEEDNKTRLKNTANYHIVEGRLSVSELENGMRIKTIQGQSLTVRKSDDQLELVDAVGNAAQITVSDIESSNGLIHVVDTVLMPRQ